MSAEFATQQTTEAWLNHRQQIRDIQQMSGERVTLIHQRLSELVNALATASANETTFEWGPAIDDTGEHQRYLPYTVRCKAVEKAFEFTVIYYFDGTQFEKERYRLEDNDRLLEDLTLKFWEHFQPPTKVRVALSLP